MMVLDGQETIRVVVVLLLVPAAARLSLVHVSWPLLLLARFSSSSSSSLGWQSVFLSCGCKSDLPFLLQGVETYSAALFVKWMFHERGACWENGFPFFTFLIEQVLFPFMSHNHTFFLLLDFFSFSPFLIFLFEKGSSCPKFFLFKESAELLFCR